MNNYPFQQQGSPSSDEIEVRALYQGLLDSWNRRSADAFAASFAEDGHVIGFDGSQMAGQAEISSTLRQIFADHLTGTYISKVRDVRLLAPGVALLRAVVGMVPHAQSDIEPAVNVPPVSDRGLLRRCRRWPRPDRKLLVSQVQNHLR